MDSCTGIENVSFEFDKNFAEDCFVIQQNNNYPKTIIKFSDVSLKYYEQFTSLKSLDNDESLIIDIEEIRQLIFDYLSVKLFLLNKKNVEFIIKISVGDKTAEISNNDVINLSKKNFLYTHH